MRLLGDFRKSIKTTSIIKRMAKKLVADTHWRVGEIFNSEDPEQASMSSKQVQKLVETSFQRERLQCRLFELGNNVYLGMELPREFENFKSAKSKNSLNRLWYEAAFEILSRNHAIRRRERRRIPRFFLDDHSVSVSLTELHSQDAFRFGSEFCFRLVSHPSKGYAIIEPNDPAGHKERIIISSLVRVLQQQETSTCALSDLRVDDEFVIVDYFEVLEKRGHLITVRSSTGHISKLKKSLRVHASSDLARGPSGYAESKVALASFDLAHYVSHRTLHLASGNPGKGEFITILIGDAQASVRICSAHKKNLNQVLHFTE